jgi:hypothetical protein
MGRTEQLIDGVVAAELEDDLDDELDVESDETVAESEACSAIHDEQPEGVLAAAAGPLSAAPGSFARISQLDGVPLFFARGVPPRPQSFSVEPGFLRVLTRTVKTVRNRVPDSFGELTRITSAGVLVAKPGFHGLGRAFDHDAWTFQHVDVRPIAGDHAAASRPKRQRYWALAALMRSRSAFVLHGHFDAAHRDHIHQDNGGPRPFTTGSEATVKLVQAVCNHIYGQSLAIDGAFGPKSQAAVTAAMQRVNLAGDVFDQAQFKRFLLRSGRLGFQLSVA